MTLELRVPLVAALLLAAPPSLWAGDGQDDPGGACSRTAAVLRSACAFDTRDNYRVAVATCLNVRSAQARKDCLAQARSTHEQDSAMCRDVRRARLEVCAALGDRRYDPPFGPRYAARFVDPLQIGSSVAANPYLPLIPGSEWKYRSSYRDEEGNAISESNTVTVTRRTKLIDGVPCVVVTDVVIVSDGTVEDTEDWLAQDWRGTVWYCGEITQQKEHFEGDHPAKPELFGIEGSWKAGREGAKPGVLMFAHPKLGQTYRQELSWVDAEDVATVVAQDADAVVAGGAIRCHNACLETRDYTALEPGAEERKYYAPGVGLILKVDLQNGTRTSLVSYTRP